MSVGLYDRELSDRVIETEREIEKLSFKSFILFKDDTDKLYKKRNRKKSPIKNTWYDSLVSHIPKSIKKICRRF